MPSITVDGFQIDYQDNGKVDNILFDGRFFNQVIRCYLDSISIRFHPIRQIQNRIVFPPQLEQIINRFFNVIQHIIENEDNRCLPAFLSTYFFNSFAQTFSRFMTEGKHVIIPLLWKKILSYAWDWELQSERHHLHKGTPYVFIAHAYLLCGDVDMGFLYLFNAIEDNIKLNEFCPSLKYPNDAPSYKTACLSGNRHNFCIGLVDEVRFSLNTFIIEYNRRFSRMLSLEKLENSFLLNESYEDIKYFFVYTFWKYYEHNIMLESKLTNNPFSKLQNLNLFFNLCIVVDKLLQINPRYGKESMGLNVPDICHKKNWLSQESFESYKEYVDFNGYLEDVIPKLLNQPIMRDGTPLPCEVQHLLISLRLRNFAGHNIIQQSVIVDKFDELMMIVICSILLVIEEL